MPKPRRQRMRKLGKSRASEVGHPTRYQRALLLTVKMCLAGPPLILGRPDLRSEDLYDHAHP